MRIAKATREGRHGKAKALQWILTHSFYAKLLAVKRVTSNRGASTPGVDNIILTSSKQKLQTAQSLKRKGYKPLPLRRIYIPKPNGKKRPLSIPAIGDRAMQALHLLALEPVAESILGKHMYGFRPKRCTADAIEQCFNALARKNSAQWILEGDIKACFDMVDFNWMLKQIPMDKTVLSKWLHAGFMEKNVFYHTQEGLPQGGIISPTIMNVVLNGLERVVAKNTKKPDKVNVIMYADDFIITGSSKEVLEQKVKPVVESFLKARGLELSEEKTKITHIDNGFDFLGFNVRKYDGKLLIKPARKNIKLFLAKIRKIIKANKTMKTAELIGLLNPKIYGWANYYRYSVAKEIFRYVDSCIFRAIWRWTMRRHYPKKGKRWVKDKYFRTKGANRWIFFAKVKDKQGKSKYKDLARALTIPIKRHIKIKADANPYDPAYKDYFKSQNGLMSYVLERVGIESNHYQSFNV